MNLTVNKNKFLTALKKVAGIIPAKPIVDVNNYALLEVTNTEIILTTNNIESQRVVQLPGTFSDNFKTLIPAKKIIDYLNKVGAIDITLEAQDFSSLNIKYSKKKAKFNCLDPQYFPTITPYGNCISASTITGEEFKRMVRQIEIACPVTHSHSILTGVKVTVKTDHIMFSASDTKVFCQCNGAATVLTDGEFIAVGEHLSNFARTVDDNEVIQISFTDSIMELRSNDYYQMNRALVGKHPVASKLFKITPEITMTLYTEELLNSLERMLPLIEGKRDNCNIVKGFINGNELLLEGLYKETGEIQEQVDIINSNNNINDFYFNAQHMINCLKQTNTADVDLLINDKTCILVNQNLPEVRYMILLIRGE